MSDELTIRTGGSVIGGWQEITVARAVDHCPSHFSIRLTEAFPGQIDRIVVTPGASCEIFLGPDKVLTGYIDRYEPRYDQHSHEVRLQGRSKVEDVVDCSVDTERLGTWTIVGGKLSAIAEKLIAPYGIALKLPDGDADIPLTQGGFAVFPGYTCYYLLEELARSVGMLVWDDADGNLVISKGGTGGRAGSALIEGQNLEEAEALLSIDQRFQTYRVVSQVPTDIAGHLTVFGTSTDNGVKRPRLKIIPAEMPLLAGYAQQRADWERAWRYGHAHAARITVSGWRDGAGKLWTPNTLVSIQAPRLKIAQDRAIAGVEWLRSELGTQTRLTVIERQGLNPRPFLPIDPLPVDNAGAGAAVSDNVAAAP